MLTLDPADLERLLDLPTAEEIENRLVPPVASALMESLSGALAPEEAEEAARRVIRGRGLPPRLAERLGDAPALTLVLFGADQIHGWVFASERVPVAGGASHLLEELHEAVGELVRPVKGITGVLYAAGGGGLLVGIADPSSEEQARMEREVRKALEARSAGLTFTVVAQPVRATDLVAAGREPLATQEGRFTIRRGLPGVLARLQARARRRKESGSDLSLTRPSTERVEAPTETPVAERCPACGKRPPGRTPVTGDEPRFWCQQCRTLSGYWWRRRKQHLEGEQPTPTFEDFAAKGARGRGYLAFLAVDGNAMGALLLEMSSLLELSAFSIATTHIYAAARQEARRLLVERHVAQDGAVTFEDASLSLLSGGDEVTLVLPACAAPEVAVSVLRTIEQGFDSAAAPDNLLAQVFTDRPETLARLRRVGAAAGVVCATASYPVRLLRHYAHELQGQAKRAPRATSGPGDARPRSSIRFTILADGSPLPEGVGEMGDPQEARLDRFEESLRECQLAVEVGVPGSGLQRLLAAWREEETGLQGLNHAQGPERTLGLLAANFFRYQMARNRPLAEWWQRVSGGPPGMTGENGEDPLVQWLTPAGGERLERLVELLALGAAAGTDSAMQPQDSRQENR